MSINFDILCFGVGIIENKCCALVGIIAKFLNCALLVSHTVNLDRIVAERICAHGRNGKRYGVCCALELVFVMI